MAASASNTTTGQYPIWIDGDKISCDDAKLKYHLTHELNYNENDSIGITQQINGHIKRSLPAYFWMIAAEHMSTEAIRVLLHSIEHSHLVRLLHYQDWAGYTALYHCSAQKNNEVIKVILDSVSEDECYQLLSITDYDGYTTLHDSCWGGDSESVRVMLNHVNQDARYSLLQMTNGDVNTPLQRASYNGHTETMIVIHESVTHTQWINLLHMNEDRKMTVLQTAAYEDKQSVCIETIRESVSDEEWIHLISTPLPEYNPRHHYEAEYQQAVSVIDELRTAARVKSALLIANQSGMK